MKSYRLHRPDQEEREYLRRILPGIALLSPGLADQVMAAWATSWRSSTYEWLHEAAFTKGVDYPLVQHVNEVVQAGLALMEFAADAWEMRPDRETMIAILLTHDVDKPLLYARSDGEIRTTAVHDAIPHGVLGALILTELGVDETIIRAVSTHALNAPFREICPETLLLHYADMLCADRALMAVRQTPFYSQRH